MFSFILFYFIFLLLLLLFIQGQIHINKGRGLNSFFFWKTKLQYSFQLSSHEAPFSLLFFYFVLSEG